MKNIYELYEVPAGVAVVDIRTGEILNVWANANRVSAGQFASCMNTLLNMQEAK
jgi:hypothetical protein